MVNFGLNAAAILGLLLAVAGAGLFFLRSIRPELARDYDIFFAAVGLLCGIILLFNGWRLDPILQFGQFLLTGTTIFFAFESIRMRGIATEQARRNTPTVDRDRPVSRTRVYTEAELDKIDPYDNVYEDAKPNYNSPRLRGYDDPQPRPTRRSPARNRPAPTADLRDEPPRRRPVRNRPEPADYTARAPQDDRDIYPPRDSRPRRPATPTTDGYDDWDRSRSAPRSRPRPPRDDIYSEPTPPTESIRRPGPADLGRSYEPEDDYGADSLGSSYDDRDLGRSYDEPNNEPEESIPGDYVVDYQPLDDSEVDYDSDEPYDYDDYDDNYEDDDYPVEDYPEPTSRPPINLGSPSDRPRPKDDDRAS
jgi:hypothetical protein